LGPDGKKRPLFCFTPFLGGKRICAGKNFAEFLIKSLLVLFVSKFDFDFVNQSDATNKKFVGVAYDLPEIKVLLKTAKK
jgi:cytochrome P450